jgi:hydroxyethylthiazole kinase-like uncharacterized protein yjeF
LPNHYILFAYLEEDIFMAKSLDPAFIAKEIQQFLPPRQRDAHKNDFGHVLVIGGDYGMAGAARMAGESALRSGAGLVSVATRHEHIPGIIASRPELMCHGIKKATELEPLFNHATTLVLGTGLGRSPWSKELFACAMQSELPMVVDADGLYWLTQYELSRENWVLTPHPGEAARLLQTTSQAIQENRLGALGMLQQQYGGVIVLKGAGTLILGKSHQPHICPSGNPGMATGGMGDILSGIIAALIAQGVPVENAAQISVSIHAQAGDQIAAIQGERGLLATDLLPYIRNLVNPT